MAEFIIIVSLAAPAGLPALDQRLVMHGFDTAIEPQGQPANAFELPRGVYRLVADNNPAGVHAIVLGHLQHLHQQGAILVFEKDPDAPFAQTGHPHWNPNAAMPVRP